MADKAGDDDGEESSDLENQSFLGNQKGSSMGFSEGLDDVEATKLRNLVPAAAVLLDSNKSEAACEVLQVRFKKLSVGIVLLKGCPTESISL